MELETSKTKSNIYFKDTCSCFYTKKKGFSIKFPKFSKRFELLTLQKNNHKLSMCFLPITTSPQQFVPRFIRLKDILSDRTVLKDYIVYESMPPCIDVCFSVDEEKIEEIITIKSPMKEVAFRISCYNMLWLYDEQKQEIYFFDRCDHQLLTFSFTRNITASNDCQVNKTLEIIPISKNDLLLYLKPDNSDSQDMSLKMIF